MPETLSNNHRLQFKGGWIVLVIFALLLLFLLILGWGKMGDLEERVTRLDQDLSLAEEQIDQQVERAHQAESRATQAEQKLRQLMSDNALVLQENSRLRQRVRSAEMALEDAQGEVEAARAAEERARFQQQQEIGRLHGALSRLVETRKTAIGLVMNLGDESLKFDFDKAELRPTHRELLSKIIGILLTSRDYSVYIYGHTDDVGTVEYNQELSERRAQSVLDYLVTGGIDSGIIQSEGFGKTKPRAAGTTALARAQNRRVEIGIVYSVVKYEETQP